MVTNGEVIQRVQTLYNHGVQSDDNRLDDRVVFNTIVNVRNLLISQKRNKKQQIGEESYQSIIIPVEEAATGSVFCLPDLGCKTWRSKDKIPDVLNSSYGTLINYIGSVDGMNPLSLTTFDTMMYVKYSKYTKNNDKCYISGGYLYLTGNESELEIVMMKAVFTDPLILSGCKLTNFNYYIETQEEDLKEICKSAYEYVFPIDSDLLETCISLSSERLLNTFIKTIQLNDEQNNAREKN